MPQILTSRFADAFAYAAELHGRQTRKGTSIPYVSHLMSVAALVLEDGGDEDEAIGGLLHDAAEDQGGEATLAEIKRRFGDKVARIVDGCTDSVTKPKPPWRERKERYVAHIREAGADVRRVSSADKLHNARSILADYRILGDGIFDRFTASRSETLWYYRALVESFRAAGGGRLVDELDRVVSEIEDLSRGRGREAS